MKKLQDFVIEELRDHGLMQDKEMQLVDLVKLNEKAKIKEQRMKIRFEQDPALLQLVMFAAQTLEIVSIMPAPDQAKREAKVHFIAEVIQIWEDANNRFNEQFTSQPPKQLS